MCPQYWVQSIAATMEADTNAVLTASFDAARRVTRPRYVRKFKRMGNENKGYFLFHAFTFQQR